MANRIYFTSTDPIARIASGARHIAASAMTFPPSPYNQDEVAGELTTFADPEFMRLAQTTAGDQRSLALELAHPMRSFL
jgi:alkylresorcinol/alkylpyrone synthase